MKLMLDTNVCLYLIKAPPASVRERFERHRVGEIGISAVTLAELEYGAARSARPAKNHEALELFVSALEVAPFDRQASVVYGRLRAALEKKGQPIGSLDLPIAAHAIRLEVRLITHNAREFGTVPGLRVENWA